MQELSKLFGSSERVKLIRLFLNNPEMMYDIDEIEEKIKVKKEKLKIELFELEKSELIIKSKENFSIEYQSGSSIRSGTREYTCYKINKKFRFLQALSSLMFDFKNANHDVLLERFKSIGRCKLFILSGVFIQDDKSRLDILYVGEAIKNNLADKVVAELAIEIGKELNIHILDLEEFNYRHKMFDRFLHDVLDSKKNIILVNKLSSF